MLLNASVSANVNRQTAGFMFTLSKQPRTSS